jgi:hypothetical protein
LKLLPVVFFDFCVLFSLFLNINICRYLAIVFQVLDDDSNGCLDLEEVRESFDAILDLTLTDVEFKDEYSQMDKNFDGSISFKEYRKYFKHPKKKKQAILSKRTNPIMNRNKSSAESNLQASKGKGGGVSVITTVALILGTMAMCGEGNSSCDNGSINTEQRVLREMTLDTSTVPAVSSLPMKRDSTVRSMIAESKITDNISMRTIAVPHHHGNVNGNCLGNYSIVQMTHTYSRSDKIEEDDEDVSNNF